MKTYQDWLEVADKTEDIRMNFIKSLINNHTSSDLYRKAVDAETYYSGQNATIKKYTKYLFDANNNCVPDFYSANHKIATRFFYRSVTQANSTLLGNGISWESGKGEEALGKDFDRKIMEAGKNAQIGGVCFGFYNNNRVEIYKITEFVPLLDEEDGSVKAGVRFWRIDDNKPLRANMFELDGITEYQWDKKHPEGIVLTPKKPYITVKKVTEAFGEEENYEYKNYPTFPVVPCWANSLKQSELEPIRATLDCYDLINSKYADDIDDANLIYWTITNAGGMDDVDLVKFLDKLRKIHAAQTDGDQVVQANTVDVPFESREAILTRLEKQLYKDSMSLNTYDIASGAITATQIQASYEPLNEKLDEYETQLTDFIERLLFVAGVEDRPTYTRSIIVNKTEEINALMNSALYLDEEYLTEKIMTTFGDKDKVQEALDRLANRNVSRLTSGVANADTEVETEV